VLDSRWVKFELKDYREVEGQFDRIVSVGMFQGVGPRQTARITSCGGSREAPSGLKGPKGKGRPAQTCKSYRKLGKEIAQMK